jgi:lycopene cyclase domain-containing protein
MSYTAASLLAVVAAVGIDLFLLRTRLLCTRRWWIAYAIVVIFQLITDGWLTDRRIVTYDPAVIAGLRIGIASMSGMPVEDLGFGFALVLLTTALWVRLQRGRPTSARPRAVSRRPRPGRTRDEKTW